MEKNVDMASGCCCRGEGKGDEETENVMTAESLLELKTMRSHL